MIHSNTHLYEIKSLNNELHSPGSVIMGNKFSGSAVNLPLENRLANCRRQLDLRFSKHSWLGIKSSAYKCWAEKMKADYHSPQSANQEQSYLKALAQEGF